MSRVVVYHEFYGCDTGCCGHVVELDGEKGEFSFAHPWNEDPRQFAEDLVRSEYGEDHVADLDWSRSFVIAD